MASASAGILIALTFLALSPGSDHPAAQSAGLDVGQAASCAPGSRNGHRDYDDTLETPAGLAILVRTPVDYDSSRAYPLLVVFPPAGFNRHRAEHFYDLTGDATRRGFVVAYSDSIVLSGLAVHLQAAVASRVAARFCVDRSRIAYLGHSDGGSMAEGVPAFAPGKSLHPSAIVASAAGIDGFDLAAAACPDVPSVLIVHSRDDDRFPGFGRSAALYWGACAGCTPPDVGMASPGCRSFERCRDGRRVSYCETAGRHERWPDMNRTILTFVQNADGRQNNKPFE